MRNRKKYFLLIPFFALACFGSVYVEDYYRELVRFFYEFSSNGSITFIGSNLQLTSSYFFIISFAVFFTLLAFTILQRSFKQLAFLIPFAIILFFMVTGVLCLINGSTETVECTACFGGKKVLSYTDVDYDKIFFLSMAVSAVSFMIVERFLTKKVVIFREYKY